MITRKALRTIALASSCLAPLAALAQAPAPAAGAPTPTPGVGGMVITGEAGFGLMGVMGTNAAEAGRYSGFNTTGIDLLGNFDVNGRSPWDSGGTNYFEFNGNNLVLQTGRCLGWGFCNDSSWSSGVTNNFSNEGSLEFKAGQQGTWGIGAYFNSITYTGNAIDSLFTVYGNQGVLNAGLFPYGGAPSQTSNVFAGGPGGKAITSFTGPQLAATGALLPVQTGTRRDIVGGDFKYLLGDWTFTGAFRHEHKEGSMEEAFDQSGTGGGVAFALPIDYDTDRYDASAAYYTHLFQGVLQYTFSHFTDNNSFVTLPYPTANSASPYQRSAAYATPPSNSAHYLTLMLATNAIPETRINLNARVGLEKQDDTFAPNTASPGAAALLGTTGFFNLNPLLQGTGANTSPDITATIYQVKLSASSHLIPNTDINAFYGIDGRNVTLNTYSVYGSGSGSDNGPGTTAAVGAAYAFVVPQDWTKQAAGADVTYRLIPEYNTRLTIGYRADIIDRSNAQVGHSWTNTASAAVMSDLGPQLTGKISFDYSDRSGSLSYLTPWLNLDGPTAGQTFSGAYYQAPMTSEAVTARLDYAATDNLSADFFLQFKNENYNYPATPLIAGATALTIPITGVGTGLKQDYALTLGPNINYRPMKNVNLHFFYTYELLMYNNLGNGDCADAANIANAALGCTGSAGYFQNKDTSTTHTVGVSGEWKVTDKLKLKGDYTVSYGSVAFTEFNGVICPATPIASYQCVSNYPDVNALMNNVRLTATYEVVPNVELMLQGIYTSYHNTDWRDDSSAIQGAGTTSISILTPGYAQPNWSVGMIMGGVKIKFGAPPPLLPAVAAAAPAPMVQAARSYLVFFDWDKATLTDRARQIIKEAADNSTHVQYTRIEVNGYTDTSGTPQYNQGLSIRRANAVKAELVKDGVPVAAITTQGFGETHLLVPTGAGVREPQNRRVEIIIR